MSHQFGPFPNVTSFILPTEHDHPAHEPRPPAVAWPMQSKPPLMCPVPFRLNSAVGRGVGGGERKSTSKQAMTHITDDMFQGDPSHEALSCHLSSQQGTWLEAVTQHDWDTEMESVFEESRRLWGEAKATITHSLSRALMIAQGSSPPVAIQFTNCTFPN